MAEPDSNEVNDTRPNMSFPWKYIISDSRAPYVPLLVFWDELRSLNAAMRSEVEYFKESDKAFLYKGLHGWFFSSERMP